MEAAWLETLEHDACLEHLRSQQVGRVALVHDGSPLMLPVMYRLVETGGLTWVAFRTRPGNVIDPDAAGFRERFDARPWLAAERESWLVIEPFVITGRELHPSEPDWAFHVDAYL